MAVRKLTETFYELTGVIINNSSQLKLFNILQDIKDDEKFMNIFRSYKLNKTVTTSIVYYELYEVDNEDWWDNISYKFYGTPNLWWIVALMNDVVNPFEELIVGDTIKILKESYLYNLYRDIERIAGL